MQLIDQVEVSDASSRQVLSGSNIQDDVDKFASFVEATSYTDDDYTSLGAKNNFDNLYEKNGEVLGTAGGGKSYRNK